MRLCSSRSRNITNRGRATSPPTSTASAAPAPFDTIGLSVLLVADHEAAPALALLRGGGVEPRPLPRALDERDYLQRIESG